MFGRLFHWMDERANLSGLDRVLLRRHTPVTTNWWFTFGSSIFFLLILQTVTGILLAMNYVPSSEASPNSTITTPDGTTGPVSLAYASVYYIMTEVPFGSFLRSMHFWGATLTVVAALLHTMRVFAMGAYKFPRELNWVIGIVILLVILAFGLTGYLLPWDQKAYWATVVAADIAGSVPLIGDYAKSILAGGTTVGAVTLTRFYAAHVLILPVTIFSLIGVHLYLVIVNGVQGTPDRIDDAYEHKGG